MPLRLIPHWGAGIWFELENATNKVIFAHARPQSARRKTRAATLRSAFGNLFCSFWSRCTALA
jgi:hypothetical protein